MAEKIKDRGMDEVESGFMGSEKIQVFAVLSRSAADTAAMERSGYGGRANAR
ncbi:hypothetical protein [Paenibacillus sp. BR1-192]|uniref:hypothetical protein n=1 Tax=Paenibacillus sp. BR1-192 TaxID=3032287 RepID=UPI00240E6163|nr:hypothetical protein [Paenibacillus sp. BR1-192]WFB55557.1 hypothetical protein P0X86_16060 [Paenibacillus sp. BR1-192]